jgi:hypothetical protein
MQSGNGGSKIKFQSIVVIKVIPSLDPGPEQRGFRAPLGSATNS